VNEKEEHEEHTEQKDVLVCLDPKDLPHVFSQQQSSLVPVDDLNPIWYCSTAISSNLTRTGPANDQSAMLNTMTKETAN
jgi:hypothetical protein